MILSEKQALMLVTVLMGTLAWPEQAFGLSFSDRQELATIILNQQLDKQVGEVPSE